MHKYKIDDIVITKDPREDQGKLGIVINFLNQDLLFIRDLESERIYEAKPWEIEYCSPVYVSDEMADKLARFEINAIDFMGFNEPFQRVRTHNIHFVTVSDLIAVLKKATNMPIADFIHNWLLPIEKYLILSFDLGDIDDEEDFLPTERTVVALAIQEVKKYITDKNNDYSAIINMLTQWEKDQKLPLIERHYSVEAKTRYIEALDYDDNLNFVHKNELMLYKKFIDELIPLNNHKALYAKAYGCYNGNRAFPYDPVVSRDCLLKLCEIDENPFLANTLGYIYYYGRANNGVPEYDKAFKYFTIGAAGGIYESRYKLADMFKNGWGVSKNATISAQIIEELYKNNIIHVYQGHCEYKFADVALRAGNLYRDGIAKSINFEIAYYYYLQAQFAIKQRMKKIDYVGDEKVYLGIEETLKQTLAKTSFTNPVYEVIYSSLDDLLNNTYDYHKMLDVNIAKQNADYILTFKIHNKSNEYRPRFFVTEPQAHFCGYLDELEIKIKIGDLVVGGHTYYGDNDLFLIDEYYGNTLYYDGEEILRIESEDIKFKFKQPKEYKTYHFASLKLEDEDDTQEFLCDDESIKVGDWVLYEGGFETEEALVKRIYDMNETETSNDLEDYKVIIRKIDKYE